MSNNVMNIVNFVRGCEPRRPKDLYTPVAQEIAVNRENGLKSTFLLQYDAMLRPDFQELFLREQGADMMRRLPSSMRYSAIPPVWQAPGCWMPIPWPI